MRTLLVSTPWISVPELKCELENLCRDSDWMTRIRAAWILHWENMPSEAIATVFRQCLETDDKDQLFLACVYLGFSEDLAKPFEKHTARLLNHPDEGVRIAAASANANAEAPSKAIEILHGALKLEHYICQTFAAATLLKRGVHVKEANELLAMAFTHPEQEVQIAAANSIMLAGKRGAPIVKWLLETQLETPVDPNAMATAAHCLRDWKHDPDAASALARYVVRRVKEGKAVDVIQLASILASMGGVTEEVLDACVAELEAEEFERRGAAALLLDNFGPDAASSVPKLLARLRKESEPPVCRSIVSACVGIGESTFEPLFEMACEIDLRTYVFAMSGLASLVSKDVVPAERYAKAVLRHPHREIRLCGAGMLKLMGPIAKAAVPIAAELLSDEDREIRLQALESLFGLGGDASAAANDVIARCLSEDDVERFSADRALKAMGDEGVRALYALMESCGKEVRLCLKEVAKRIGASGKPGFAPFNWRGNPDLLRLLVAVAEAEANGPLSDRTLAERLGESPSLSWGVKDLASSASTFRKSIRKLEAQLREANPSLGKTFRLRGGQAGKSTGLSKTGRRIAELARAWLTREERDAC